MVDNEKLPVEPTEQVERAEQAEQQPDGSGKASPAPSQCQVPTTLQATDRLVGRIDRYAPTSCIF